MACGGQREGQQSGVAGLKINNPALTAMTSTRDGVYKSETIPISAVGTNQIKVQQMLDRVGYK